MKEELVLRKNFKWLEETKKDKSILRNLLKDWGEPIEGEPST